MTYHDNLCKIEAEKLRKRGFKVEFEKKIGKGCVVDIYATRGDEVVIVECGYLCKPWRQAEVKHYIPHAKFVHVPYLSQWIRYWDIIALRFPRLPEHEKKFDWREYVKPEVLKELEKEKEITEENCLDWLLYGV